MTVLRVALFINGSPIAPQLPASVARRLWELFGGAADTLPLQTWKTFLRNHAEAIAATDLCVVLTPTYDRCLHVWFWATTGGSCCGSR
jgi:hypothetical protein